MKLLGMLQGEQTAAKQQAATLASSHNIHSVAAEVRNTLRRNAASNQDFLNEAKQPAEHTVLPNQVNQSATQQSMT